MAAKWQWIGAGAVLVVGAAMLTSSYRVQNFSCAKCRNHKRVETRSVLLIDLTPKVNVDRQYAVDSDHVHDWWPYASYRHQGPSGIFGKQVTCEPHQYQDGRGLEAVATVGKP